MKPYGPSLLFVDSFFCSFDFISSYFLLLFFSDFLFLPIQSWKIVFFQEFFCFSLVVHFVAYIFYIILFHIILFLYNLLHLCGTSFHFSFISNIFYLKLLFLWWFWANFHQLCLYFQRPCSWFYWSFLLFLFTLYFVYLHCDLYYFLHFTDFGFCLLFFF